MQEKLIFAIDFDGTLCENAYPDIGEPKLDVINKVKELQKEGHELILWTCRDGQDLINALDFLNKIDLHFEWINSNPKYRIEQFNGNDARKVGADYYVDDRALSIVDFVNLKVKGE